MVSKVYKKAAGGGGRLRKRADRVEMMEVQLWESESALADLLVHFPNCKFIRSCKSE